MPTINAWDSQNPAEVAKGGTGAATLTGVLIGNGTSPVTGNAITQHDVLVAGASNAITSISPSTANYVLTSNGVSADPSFQVVSASGSVTTLTADSGSASPTAGAILVSGGSTGLTTTGSVSTLSITGTLNVAHGGTGNTTFTAYSLIAAGTTATGPFQNVSGVGTTGQVLVSQGASALPQWTSFAFDLTWIDQGSSIAILSNTNYFATAAITLTLPASPAQGDTIIIDCDTTGAVVIQANTGQFIRQGNVISASAGSSTSTARGDSMTLTYRATGTTWHGRAVQGNWTTA